MKGTYDNQSPFFVELCKEAEMISNGESVLDVNGSPMGQAVWNLICSRRDLSLYCGKYSDGRPMKMKPHRHWKVTPVKKYFGITGTGDKLMLNFMALYRDVMGEDDE